MAIFYTKDQQDAQAAFIGGQLKERTAPSTLATAIYALVDNNKFTDADKAKLASLESSKFLGTFLTSSAIPTVGAVAGSYADVDAGVGSDVERWVYDANDNKFVKSASSIAGETAASIKTKYESNADTNAFTDAEKSKLAAIQEAADITSYTAAFQAALA